MILDLPTSDRLAKAKQKRLSDRLNALALHGDYILCPVLITGFALFVRVLVS
ncbi:MAG TPA: hypothetical protein VGL34_24985 [Steroidobacteraceae bacterium]|jgi:hypothetical protein